uniref:Cyclin T2b n=1 Tax=Cynoglossus semilaevis TaxID=244447 RepID=A0A3P8VG18_CYNSE
MAVHRGPSTNWLFTREQLENTPSRRCGIEADRELSYRQQAANLIQDMGQKLNVSQLIINTAIVYMHRFYMINSFTKFHRNIISQTTLFLAAKVEEQPRKLEHVIKIAHACMNPQEPPLDTKSNAFLQLSQELVALETIVLQTLGFEITVDHPHTDVVKCSQLVRGTTRFLTSKDLAQTSYFMATNSLHLTTFCLEYRPTVVACVCIHLACKWSNWEIPVSTDGKPWWEYVDPNVTLHLLDELTHEFLQILEKTPSRLKRIRNWRVNSSDISSLNAVSSAYASFQPLAGQSKGCGYDQFSQSLDTDFIVFKQEHKPTVSSGSGGKQQQQQQQLTANAASFSRSHKVLTLEKYREKHAVEIASHNGVKEELSTEDFAPPPLLSSHHHKKRSQSQEKSSSKKSRPPPSTFVENGSASSEELKMRIKVSSDRHKDHGVSSHRHSKHGHAHSLSARAASSHGSDLGASSSSRKRPHPEAGNHYHSTKSSRSSNGGSAHYTSEGVARLTEHNSHDRTNGTLPVSGQHTDYKNTFDMLDSLLSAQGMSL